MQQRLTQSDIDHRLAAGVLNAISDAILVMDAGMHILSVNPGFTRITGYEEAEVLGRMPDMLGAESGLPQQLAAMARQQGTWRGEVLARRKSGERYTAWMGIDRIVDPAGQTSHYIATWSDISERKLAEERIYHLAHYDLLTDLPNRTLFEDRLNQAILAARRYETVLALMFVDLDHFKLVNDTLGHRVGDQLLIEVGKRLRSAIRAGDTVSRHGGDEFLILLPQVGHRDNAENIAAKIIQRLLAPCMIEGNELRISCSIGIALFPQHGQDSQELIRNADMAMYAAKQRGRNTFQTFQSDFGADTAARLSVETALRQALLEDEFELHYLPRSDSRSGRLVGVEALLRWQHPQQGLLEAAQFLHQAEESGLLLAISQWVLRRAIRQIARWQQEGVALLAVSVNLPELQLRQPGFVSELALMLEQAGVRHGWLELEFTELALMTDSPNNLRVLADLKAIGVGISIDNFGSGYSNLYRLRQLPVNSLKIDRSLVANVTSDQDNAVVVEAIISMARRMGLRVIAEGVETAIQADFLSLQACDEVQGFFFGEPRPASVLCLPKG